MSKNKKNNTQIHPNKKTTRKEVEYQEFVRFTGTPRVFREKDWGYNLDGEFAKKFKIHPSTLCEWKKGINFWDEVRDRVKFLFKDRIPDVIAGVYKKAVKDGSAAEAKLFMQWVDDWKEKSDTNVHYAAIKELQESNERLFEQEKLKEQKKNAR
jgi:hypothetical protein